MKVFWTIILTLLILVATFFIISLIMSNIHNVSMIAEWQTWLKNIGIIKDATQTVEQAVIKF